MPVFKSIVKKLIASAGYSISRKQSPMMENNQDEMAAGLERMKLLQINPDVIIDIGAAQGTWTKKALQVWPLAAYELVEPLKEQVGVLEQLKVAHSNINYHVAVAGEAMGDTMLNVSPDLDGSGVYGNNAENARKVPVITIDEIVANIPGNVLIKLDTHGYELPILKGATEALKRTCLLVIEVYGFNISPTCLLFHELSVYLDDVGFRLIDIVDIMRRPCDNAFWQADAFYARKDNPVFEKESYA